MKSYFYRLSYKNRIRLAFTCLILIAVSTTSIMTYYMTSRIMADKALESSQDMLYKSAQAFDEKLRHLAVSLSNLLISDAFKAMVRSSEYGETESYFKHYSALQVPFMQLRLNEPLIRSVLLVTPIGEFYPPPDARVTQNTFRDSEYYKRFDAQHRTMWIEGHADPFFSDHDRVISLILGGITDNPQLEVYVIVNISEEGLMDYLLENANEYRDGIAILGTNGQPLMDQPFFQYEDLVSEPSILGQISQVSSGSFDHRVKQDRLLVTYQRSKVIDDWVLVSIKKRSVVLQELKKVQWIVVGATGFSVLLALLLSNLLAHFLSGPLIKLKKLMRAAGDNNDLTVRFVSPYQDELSVVGEQFNLMLSQISSLIQEVKTVEADKRKTEIKSLQAQIDPHFLYNTLNAIYWKAGSQQRVSEVQQMVMSLSKLFKLGLNNGQEWTTVDKELQHAEHYLKLQANCYQNLFQYEIRVEDPDLLQLSIPKIIIQPLVENSIIHGFKNWDTGGRILIRVYNDQNHYLVMEVRDNGSGMDTQQIMRDLQLDNSSGSFALRNVYQRLKLYFGDSIEMVLAAADGETSVILRIPYNFNDSKVELHPFVNQ
ncbi:hypothetical protein BBD42_24820 [Paenibacillus sp. BIHB 4019]|uniref:HAMP domain-containing protein n=1 Tax=Paenibacillus sp. BIHB 4019 TaxID=1870819 RepID=A0A1B2DNR6_9BACL|nr:sensor histidine kinase [Paenibacillus sp. BIHB 4019]ANY69348.1 hypothetical protein BBD42_24820 [Paenibacillus sp. BIHB 4019]